MSQPNCITKPSIYQVISAEKISFLRSREAHPELSCVPSFICQSVGVNLPEDSLFYCGSLKDFRRTGSMFERAWIHMEEGSGRSLPYAIVPSQFLCPQVCNHYSLMVCPIPCRPPGERFGREHSLLQILSADSMSTQISQLLNILDHSDMIIHCRKYQGSRFHVAIAQKKSLKHSKDCELLPGTHEELQEHNNRR